MIHISDLVKPPIDWRIKGTINQVPHLRAELHGMSTNVDEVVILLGQSGPASIVEDLRPTLGGPWVQNSFLSFSTKVLISGLQSKLEKGVTKPRPIVWAKESDMRLETAIEDEERKE